MSILSMSGSARYTADSVIGSTGEPSRVYNVTWLSGTTAGDIVLRNGSSASGDIYVQEAGTISKTKTLSFGVNGLLFPDGCFFDKDANTTAAVVEFTKEQ